MDRDLAVSLDPNQVSPGLLGFLIVCVLGVLVWMLCRNMGKHLTKLDDDYQAEQGVAELAEAVPAQAKAAVPDAGKAPARKPRPGAGKAGRA
jgi:hypothetical protein